MSDVLVDFEKIVAQIQANVSYDLDDDPVKAKALVTACRQFLALGVSQAAVFREHSVSLDPSAVQRMHDRAIQWLASHGELGKQPIDVGFTRMDLSNWRT